ncbi:MAG: helix-turn-helix domain-containing protein [Blautia hansenii]
MDFKEMGQQIKKKRLEKNWRQEDLAEQTDLTATSISLIVRGKKCPTLETFFIIANALDASADELLASALNNGYALRVSTYLEQLKKLSEEKQKTVCDIVEVLLRNE